jgi:hypothetical protein
MIYGTTSEKTKHRYFSLKKLDSTDILRAIETLSIRSGFKQAINNWSFVLIYNYMCQVTRTELLPHDIYIDYLFLKNPDKQAK